jgi:hypothetical protein
MERRNAVNWKGAIWRFSYRLKLARNHELPWSNSLKNNQTFSSIYHFTRFSQRFLQTFFSISNLNHQKPSPRSHKHSPNSPPPSQLHMLLTCFNFSHIFFDWSNIGSRHTIKVFWSLFVYSIYFIDSLSISAYKKFMIFSINHFSAEAHRIKWTRHRLFQVKSDIFFTTFISLPLPLHQRFVWRDSLFDATVVCFLWF